MIKIKKQYIELYSKALESDISMTIYGHFGLNVLYFSLSSQDEIENHIITKSLTRSISTGRVKIISIDNLAKSFWYNNYYSPEEKSNFQFKFNEFLENELILAIYNDSGSPVPIITTGFSDSAIFAANAYFRRPDLFIGTLSFSGIYDIRHFSKEYFDKNCYFNSPIHYIPNLNDNYWLTFLQKRHHVHLITGSGIGEYPPNSEKLSNILKEKHISRNFQIWDEKYSHDFNSWSKLFAYYIKHRL